MSSASSISTPNPPAQRSPGRWKHVLKRAVQAVVGLIVLLLIVGASYEWIAHRSDARRFEQQGRSVALGTQFGDLSLNLDCSGPPADTAPTVILDSGLGVPAAGWKLVQDEVARFAHVCSYDRAGYGWSGASSQPRTSLQIAEELHALLAAAGERGPYVIVGHSFGGYNVRVYTGKYPDDVVGMVLVDASHEDQVARMPPAMQALMAPPTDAQLTMVNVMRTLGLARVLRQPSPGDEALPEDFVRQLAYLQNSGAFTATAAAELRSFDQSAGQVRAAGNLGDRPLIVLTAGKDTSADDRWPPSVSRQDIAALRGLWVDELQVSQMQLSTRGKRTIVADSSHMIPFERPAAVVAAIREVWDAARAPH